MGKIADRHERDAKSNAFLEAGRLFREYDYKITQYLENIAYGYLNNDVRAIFEEKRKVIHYLREKKADDE